MTERTHHEPETLDDIADRLAEAGGRDTAEVIRLCAAAWRHDQRDLQVAQADNSALQQTITQAQRTLTLKKVA